MSSGVLALCEQGVALARAAGADQAEAFACHSSKVVARAEQGDLTGAQVDESTELGLRVIRRGAVGFAWLNRPEPRQLETLAQDALALAAVSADGGDTHELPGASATAEIPAMWDAGTSRLTVAGAVQHCHALVASALRCHPSIRVDGAEVEYACQHRAVFSSQGVRSEERGTCASAMISGMAVHGEEVSSWDAEMEAEVGVAALRGAGLGQVLGERLPRLLDARTYDGPGTPTVVLSPDALAEVLLGPLLESLDGDAIFHGRSRMRAELGKVVAHADVTLVDDPLEPGQVGCGAFDREGQANLRLPLVERGVLNSFLHNATSARRLKAVNNAHATGGPRAVPGIGTHRLVMTPGAASLEDLIKEASDGILMERFSGTVDAVSGDFSGVAKCSFRIRDGHRAECLKETTVAGNAFDLLRRIQGISRSRKKMPVDVLPYVLVRGMTVSGG